MSWRHTRSPTSLSLYFTTISPSSVRSFFQPPIVVAQRISTVLDADLILVLEHGRIVARGTHAALMESSPVYREIYDSQLGRRA